MQRSFYEFFAGAGMVRAGLGAAWTCTFANDFDPKKSASYRRNWGPWELVTADIANLSTSALPGKADLAWASFPCQDLSLAGPGAGLRGKRSGTFWPFWKLIQDLAAEDRAPSIVVLENVCGALTSHGGQDFAAICGALSETGYRMGALVIDAAHFVPQSRPRLFLIGVHADMRTPRTLIESTPSAPWITAALETAHAQLPEHMRQSWIWWRLPAPPTCKQSFLNLLDKDAEDWFPAAQTRRLVSMMSPAHRAKLTEAQRTGRRSAGTLYRRTRYSSTGERIQRAEVRFDGLAGCLRTPAGGSSRQVVVVVEGGRVRSRLMTARETARLMGLPDSYVLPENYTDAYHLTGDGVAVPVVRHLAEHLFEPLLAAHVKAATA